MLGFFFYISFSNQQSKQTKQINNNLNEAIAIAVNKASKNLDEVDRENFYRVFFYITDNLDEICSSYLKEK